MPAGTVFITGGTGRSYSYTRPAIKGSATLSRAQPIALGLCPYHTTGRIFKQPNYQTPGGGGGGSPVIGSNIIRGI